MARFCLDFSAPGFLKFGPWCCEAHRPFGCAMGIDDALLRGRKRGVAIFVHNPNKSRDIHLCIDVVVHGVIDPEQHERTPWEKDSIGYATLQKIPRGRSGSLHVRSS